MRRPIRKDPSGQWSTDKGYKDQELDALDDLPEKPVQPRFYLGKDKRVAIVRARMLDRLWECACYLTWKFRYRECYLSQGGWGGFYWEPWSMDLAKQIAKKGGRKDTILFIPGKPDWFPETEVWTDWLRGMRLDGLCDSPEPKKSLRLNVSQWIRDYKQANPNATNTDIIKAGEKLTLPGLQKQDDSEIVKRGGFQIQGHTGLRLDYQKVGNALKALKKGATCPFCERTVATKRGKFLPHKTSSVPRQSDPLCEGSRTLAPTAPNAGEGMTSPQVDRQNAS